MNWKRIIRATVLALVVVLIGCYYLWTACSTVEGFGFIGRLSHYNLLTRAFQAGQLFYLEKPKPEMLELDDPYDPAQNYKHRMHDACYYEGKYCTYFGPAPVFTQFLPWKLVTGLPMLNHVAATINMTLIFLLGTCFLLKLRNRFAPGSSFAVFILCVIAFGLVNPFSFLLREPAAYTIAITQGCFWCMLGCLVLFCAVERILDGGVTWRTAILLAAAGTSYGIGIASRANYVLGIVVFLLPAFIVWRKGGKLPHVIKLLLAPGIPLLIIGILLIWYNYARFGNVWETGLSYQLVTSPAKHSVNRWSFQNFLHNAYLYFLLPVWPDHIFPFFHLNFASNWNPVAGTLKGSPYYYGPEPVWGILLNAPLIFGLVPAVWLMKKGGLDTTRKKLLGMLLLIVLAPAVLNICVLLIYAACSMRYLLDFLPWILLAALLGWLMLSERIRGVMWQRCVVGLCFGLMLGWSTVLNLGTSIVGYHDSFRKRNPAYFYRIQELFDSVTASYHLKHLDRYGGIDLKLKFPAKSSGSEILALVWPWQGIDIVYVQYQGPRLIQFVVDNMRQTLYSKQVLLRHMGEHHVTIELGSLYPRPSAVLLEKGYDPAKTKRARITIGGTVVMDEEREFDEAHPDKVGIGKGWKGLDIRADVFSGEIVSVERLPVLK